VLHFGKLTNIRLGWKNLERDEHSSLLGRVIVDEEKKVYKPDTLGLVP
jgi:hypothetical protein